jgi:hypothetical protein
LAINDSRRSPVTDENPFELREQQEKPESHVYRSSTGRQFLCATERKARPKNRTVSINEIVVGLGNVIPLWAPNTILYWRFNEASFRKFAKPQAAKRRIGELFDRAVALWGDAAPVRFQYQEDGWDFDVALRNSDDCDERGCTLARAFFPAIARDRITIYPRMLQQDEAEQVETMVHELGHVFGLRHFFANVSETRLPSEIFGTHAEFSIMNYGAKSVLTDADRTDLRELYRRAWNGELTAINGTRIQLMQPLSALAPDAPGSPNPPAGAGSMADTRPAPSPAPA